MNQFNTFLLPLIFLANSSLFANDGLYTKHDESKSKIKCIQSEPSCYVAATECRDKTSNNEVNVYVYGYKKTVYNCIQNSNTFRKVESTDYYKIINHYYHTHNAYETEFGKCQRELKELEFSMCK
jgi:hypothetical protein